MADAWDAYPLATAPTGWDAFPPADKVVPPAPLPDYPLSSRILTGTDDAVRAAANTVTMGMADRIAGAGDTLIGKAPSYNAGVDAQVALSNMARERSPYASMAGDAAGIAMLPNTGGALAARMGGGALARIAGYGAEGAATGAAQGAGNTYTGNLSDYLKNAGMGGLFGLGTGATAGAAFAPRAPRLDAATPTVAELRAAKNAQYDTLRDSPAAYHPNAVANMAGDAEQHLYNEGFGPRYSPQTWGTFDMLHGYPPGATVTPGNLDFARKQLNRIPFSDLSATDRESGRILKERIDDFIANPPPGAVRPGSEAAAAQASDLAQNARGNYATMKRGQALENIATAAEDAAASAGSGMNRENAFRAGVKNFINPKTAGYEKRTRGFTPDEIDMLRNEIVRRGPIANAARTAGNMMAGGGGIGAPIVAAAATGSAGGLAGKYFADDPATGSAVGIAVPAVGMGLRGASNRSAANAVARVTDTILQRSPLYRERAALAPMVPGPSLLSGANTARARDAVALELLRQQQQPNEQ
jgi:hypothetical protein